MTEAQWFAARAPGPLLDALGNYASERKLRLFACACCRRMWDLLPDPRCRTALEVAELFADDLTSARKLAEADGRLLPLLRAAQERWARNDTNAIVPWCLSRDAEYIAFRSLRTATSLPLEFNDLCAHFAVARWAAEQSGELAFERALQNELAAQADLVRDLFGEWFQPVTPTPTWFTSDVLALASNIYDNCAFEHMPILADALQDAGCGAEELLRHCRDASQLHARGCWAVDLILGRV